MRRRASVTIFAVAAAAVAFVATCDAPAPAAALSPACTTVATCTFGDATSLAANAFALGPVDAPLDDVASFGTAGGSPRAAIPVLAYASRAVRTFVDAAGDAAASDAAIVASLVGAPIPYGAFGAGDAPLHVAVTRRPAVLPTTLPRF